VVYPFFKFARSPCLGVEPSVESLILDSDDETLAEAEALMASDAMEMQAILARTVDLRGALRYRADSRASSSTPQAPETGPSRLPPLPPVPVAITSAQS